MATRRVERTALECGISRRDVDDGVGELVHGALAGWQGVRLALMKCLALHRSLPLRHHRGLIRVCVVRQDSDEGPSALGRVERESREQKLGGRGHRVAPKPERAQHHVKPPLPRQRRERIEIGVLVDRRHVRRGLCRRELRLAASRRAKERGELVRRRRALLSGCLATEKQRDSVA